MGEDNKAQGIGLIAGAAGNIGMGIANNVSNLIMGKMLQKQQLEGQKKALEQQNEAQFDLWNKTNYEAQKEHMKKAGLNPGLLYGMSGGGGATAGGASAMPDIAQGHGIMDMQSIAQMRLLQAQADNLNADTEKKKAEATKTSGVDTDLAKANTQSILEGINLIKQQAKTEETKQILNGLDAGLKEIQTQFESGTVESRIEAVKKQTGVIGEQLEALERQNDINESTKETQIRQIKANLAKTMVDIAYEKAGMAVMGQNILESKQKITSMIIEGMQHGAEVAIKGQAQSTNQARLDWEKKMKDLPDSEKAIIQIVSDMDPLEKIIKGKQVYDDYRNSKPKPKFTTKK